MLTMAPLTSCFRNRFTACLVTIAGAVRLMAITRSHRLLSRSPAGSNLALKGKDNGLLERCPQFYLSMTPALLTFVEKQM